MGAAAIEVKDVSKSFKGLDRPALNHVSMQIYPGHITGLVGPDGAGKTTLIRHIIGLMSPDAGDLSVHSFDTVRQSKEIFEICGYMPQKFGLYEDLTVLENLNLYADLRRLPKQERKEKFKKLLTFTDLERFKSRLAGKLSGGMKQKLGLACSLIGDPKVLLLDEPSVGVDPVSRRELWSMVQELLDDGIAVVWATAYLDEAEKCDTVLLLNEGSMLFQGRPTELLSPLKGRVFSVSDVGAEERRQVLMSLMREPEVLDCVLEGENIRVVLFPKQQKPNSAVGTWTEISPRFEDAFIDKLGGVQNRVSALAQHMPEKAQSDQPVIKAEKLTKVFGDFTAVSENDFQIYRGKIFGLLGPNGAGKSTTFKMMCGLLQPTQGHAYVKGLNLKTASSQARSKIGYMAQKFSLYGILTVKQNLDFFAGVYGLSSAQRKAKIKSMLDIFDLGQFRNIPSQDLPLGFKQRLALACAVMHEPDVLFLDEPTSGVDPMTRREFWLHINSLVEKGVTVMVTTHFMDEAEYCDQIGLIYRGENIATGRPSALKETASSLLGISDPTLEDAFIALIKNSDLNDGDVQANGGGDEDFS